MSRTCENSNPLRHAGTSQASRLLRALDPQSVELHGLSEEDWLKFARDYARLINYFPQDHPDKVSGNWQDFFPEKEEISSLIDAYGEGKTEPHLALLLSFLKLLKFPQKSLNALTEKHLDYYYKEVLQLKKEPFVADRVHLLFELAQNATNELVEQGTSLKAGKDSDGNLLFYKTTEPLVVNHAKVISLKSVFVDANGLLRYAPVANSSDGRGGKLADDPGWSAFGFTEDEIADKDEKERWPAFEPVFYIASPLLNLKEGNRTVSLEFTFSASSALIDISHNDIEACFTGEKDWLGPYQIGYKSRDHTKWQITLDLEKDPIVPYDETVHQAGLNTAFPALKIQFKKPEQYKILRDIDVKSIEISVDVEEIEAVQLQNELGNLDPGKPFMPFGPRPKVGSKLSVACPEMYGKPITAFSIHIQWLNLPANFSEYYREYDDAIENQKSRYIANAEYLTYLNYPALYFLESPRFINGNGTSGSSITDTRRSQFKVDIVSPYNDSAHRGELFGDVLNISIPDAPISVSRGEIELTLTESFYHDLYPELYLNAVLEAQKKAEETPSVDDDAASSTLVDLPNEPYTPLLDQLRLGYTAKETISFVEENPAAAASVMYHGHPFGAKQVMTANKTLVAEYRDKEFYIGLENMEPGSNISLLFQIDEGSENPLHSSFSEGERPDWAVLSANSWQKLKETAFARDETNNFLRSGIAEVAIPESTNTNNTLLQRDRCWLRIRLKKESDAVCRFINVYAQATEAVFDNHDNATGHLIHGLPAGTIAKMVNPRAKIKSVNQPYASFGGEPVEADLAFYRRVSERLRHKYRAISIWDYEHLVLEEFPSLYKVKCLNHSRWDGHKLEEFSPGDVTLVLIPKVAGTRIEKRLKPKVSQDFKDRVETFINRKNSIHVNTAIANPVYELVLFEFDIQFKSGLDFNFHRNLVSDNLKKMLAPWVFEPEADIAFGGTLTEYQVVNYLENLAYVDYIENFRMLHQPLNADFEKKSVIEPSNPMAILIPADHTIEKVKPCA